MEQDVLLDLIGQLYEAPGDSGAWQHLVPQLSRAFDAEHSHMVVFDRPGRVLCDFVSLADAGDAYANHYAALDVAVHRLLRGPDRRAASQLDLMTPDELRACPMHQEMLPRFGVEHRLWVKGDLGGGLTYTSAIIRSPRQGAFDLRSYRLLETLHRHIERAMRLHLEIGRLQSMAASLEAGLDMLRTGLVLLDATGSVMFVNRAGRALLDAKDGLRLERGALAAATASGQRRLEAVVARAIGRSGPAAGGELALERQRGRAIVLRTLPITASAFQIAPRAVAVVLMQDPERPDDIAPEALAMLGLTPSESRLVAALVHGQSLDDYAQATDRRPHTVRSTLRDVFARTATRRQSELIALVLRTLGLP